MKTSDVVSQLMASLPFYTDYFHDNLSIQSLIVFNNIIRAKTSTAHNLQTGDTVAIYNAKVRNPITQITPISNTTKAELITENDNDLTFGVRGFEQVNIDINGELHSFPLVAVMNRCTFVIDFEGPIPAGDFLLIERLNKGFNGFHQITVQDQFTFTYPIQGIAYGEAYQEPITATSNLRVAGEISIDRVLDFYERETEQDKFWCFAVIGDDTTSKSRRTLSDNQDIDAAGHQIMQQLIEPFSIVVIAPVKTLLEINGTLTICDIKDEMISTIRTALFKSLLGVPFPAGITGDNQFSTVYVNSFAALESSVNYAHQFNFQIPITYITNNDKGVHQDHVAFREITLQQRYNLGNGQRIIKVNLDDVPK
jgi:hypothetical protein